MLNLLGDGEILITLSDGVMEKGSVKRTRKFARRGFGSIAWSSKTHLAVTIDSEDDFISQRSGNV